MGKGGRGCSINDSSQCSRCRLLAPWHPPPPATTDRPPLSHTTNDVETAPQPQRVMDRRVLQIGGAPCLQHFALGVTGALCSLPLRPPQGEGGGVGTRPRYQIVCGGGGGGVANHKTGVGLPSS